MPKKLRKLKIDRVDLVDNGANPEAHILLFKRDDETEEDIDKAAMTLQEILDHDEAMREACEDKWKITEAFQRSLQSISQSDDEEERMRLTMTSAAQFVRLMGPVVDTLNEMEEVYMADKTQAKADTVDKSANASSEETTHNTSSVSLEDVVNLHVEVKELKKELETKDSQIAAVTKRAEMAEAELAKRDDSPGDDIWKTATPAQRKALEAERQKAIELEKRVQEGERYIRQRECIAKASSFEYLPINPDDDWEIFHEIDKMSEEHANRIYQLLKAGDLNLRKSGIGKERGFGGTGDGPGESPLEQMEWLANEEIAKSGNTLTYDQALAKAAQANPKLYRQYTREIQTRSDFDKGD